MGWFASWMLNPWMLGIGALAMSVPIIIHLLNRRRFKIVEWAAMRFLLDADKKNRRRVRIENLILLLLRCLAMLLLGLMIARPFLPSNIGGLLGSSQRFERMVILDDSLSQQVVHGNQTLFERAKVQIKELVTRIAHDDNQDFLTLYLTSRPDKPLLTNEPVTADSIGQLVQSIDDLECSDQQAQYQAALQEVQRYAGNGRTDVNRLVYVLSDMRVNDWSSPERRSDETAPHRLLEELGQQVSEVSLVDVGNEARANLAIVEVQPQDLLVANTIVRFAVTVANYGEQRAENIDVLFQEGEQPPLTETIPSLGPGQTASVEFRYLFKHEEDELAEIDVQKKLQENRLNYRLTAELRLEGDSPDYLPSDSKRYYAARVLKGIPILIVDGDPSPIPERSESFFLRRISVPGTGLLVDVVTASELETVSLSQYKVIFLLNVDEASADRITSLEQWVAEGGGLVFMPGGIVRASRFNESFYREGEGLSPSELVQEDGDPTMSQWVNFEITDRNHPALRVAQDQEVSLGKVEIFSWWDLRIPDEAINTTVSVPLRLSNDRNSPAMAEKTFGDGKAITFAVPADGDWSVWPVHPTYVCVMWDLVNYLVGRQTAGGSITVGNSITHPVDLSRYDIRVGLTDPAENKTEGTAVPLDDTEESKQSVLYQVKFEELPERGFYELNLRAPNRSDEVDKVLYAANVDPFESDLQRVDVLNLPDDYFGAETRLISGDQLSGKIDSSTTSGLWPKVLLMLFAVLGLEQFLGWWFGRKR